MKKIIELPCGKGDKIYLVDKIFKRLKTRIVEHVEYIENTNADFPFTMVKGSIISGSTGNGFGFSIFFNIHGPGTLVCALGGLLTWAAYSISITIGADDLTAFFFASVFAAAFSETMARIRKYPAISYLVVSIFPLIPGAGVYYTMNYAVRGEMQLFADKGMHTAAVAGIMAVGILLVSTTVRLITVWMQNHIKKDA